MSDRPQILRPADLYLLLALADAPMHGYALAQRMTEESEGRVRMLPGNLYAIIRRLERDGLVTPSLPSAAAELADRRRRCFALTDRGRQALRDEARRMARTVDLARRRLLEAGMEAGLRDREVTS